MARLRIVSLNAWGGRCWPALGEWIAALKPDVLCLQEVTRAPCPSPPWLEYRDAHRVLDQRTDLFADVSACLPGWQAGFAAAARGPLRSPEGRKWVSEHGLGTWVAPGLAVTERVQGFVHGSFRRDGWGPEPVPRAMQVLRIELPNNGETCVIGHFHGLRDPSGKGDTPARARQAGKALALLRGVATEGEAVVMGGDFNILPGAESFAIWRNGGLADQVAARGIADTRTVLYRKPQRHANYMLTGGALDILSFEVPGSPVVSDHRAMIIDIVIG